LADEIYYEQANGLQIAAAVATAEQPLNRMFYQHVAVMQSAQRHAINYNNKIKVHDGRI